MAGFVAHTWRRPRKSPLSVLTLMLLMLVVSTGILAFLPGIWLQRAGTLGPVSPQYSSSGHLWRPFHTFGNKSVSNSQKETESMAAAAAPDTPQNSLGAHHFPDQSGTADSKKVIAEESSMKTVEGEEEKISDEKANRWIEGEDEPAPPRNPHKGLNRTVPEYHFNEQSDPRLNTSRFDGLQTLSAGVELSCSTPTEVKWQRSDKEMTGLQHVLFNLASSGRTWPQRVAFTRTWWNATEVRGYVWTDVLPASRETSDPELRLYGDTSHIRHHGAGMTSFLRMARIVVEAFHLNLPNVRWFVVGDDDTFFSPRGIAGLLSKYDHTQMLYIGSQSETHWQNSIVSHEIAFGGGGYAISGALAAALNRTLDECMERYSELWCSDQRVAACVSELGVHVTRERGFHQCDLQGSIAGLMEAHPPEVFASLHHLHVLRPVIPSMVDRLSALRHLSNAIRPDPIGFLQQAICYDQLTNEWTASIAWGYSVKVYPKTVRIIELDRMERTSPTFTGHRDPPAYDMNTRSVKPMAPSDQPCGLPYVMYIAKVESLPDGGVQSTYERPHSQKDIDRSFCDIQVARLHSIRVIRSHPMRVEIPENGLSAGPNMRRQCCKQTTFHEVENQTVGTILLGDCEEGELIAPRRGTTH